MSNYYGFEGYGTNTRGGYGQWPSTNPQVIHVTNLNASGTGSLKAACDASGPRVVVFDVSGIINISGTLDINNPYITIAGQTAPSPGIMLKTGYIWVATHDVIIQHIRCRTGPPTNSGNCNWWDGLDVEDGSYNVVIDHCSISWAVDEVVGSWYGCHDVTIQWCIISEGLHCNCHPQGCHSKGLLFGGLTSNISIHHNYWAHNEDRNPLIGGETTEIINNVMYNWGSDPTKFEGAYGTTIYSNIIGNYYKPGEDSWDDYGVNLNFVDPPCKFYIHDNISPRRPNNTYPDWAICATGYTSGMQSTTPLFSHSNPVTLDDVFTNVNTVLQKAGARAIDRSLELVDNRVVNDFVNNTGNIIDSPSDVGGWPNLANHNVVFDSGSNPHSNSGNGYSNLEVLLRSLAIYVEGGGGVDCSSYSTQSTCESNGCYWYNSACHSTAPSSCTTLNNQTDCLSYGCYWYNNSCHSTSNLDICVWIADHGGATGLDISEVFQIVDAYIYGSPPSGYGFVPTVVQVMGIIDYYLGFIESGNTKTGCATGTTETFGFTGTGGTYGDDLENRICATKATPTNNGILSSITAYIYLSSGSVTQRAAIYNSSLTLLGESSVITNNTTGWKWKTFTFSPGVQLIANQPYYLVVWSDDFSGTTFLKYGDQSGTWQGYLSRDYTSNNGEFPLSIAGWTNQWNNSYYCVYGTYTTT